MHISTVLTNDCFKKANYLLTSVPAPRCLYPTDNSFYIENGIVACADTGNGKRNYAPNKKRQKVLVHKGKFTYYCI